MLMPILTARTSAQTASVVPVEASQARDRLQAPMLSISGPRAEAILKILETLGRHLNGSEVLPKEALAKLMETLARILKFPPLPQETSQDLGRRLAGFLEKLSPEARVVLEKQLGQRNLALQVRLLTEVLHNPPGSDAGRLRATLQNPAFLTSPARDAGQQVRSPLPQPALPAQHLATLTAGSAPVMFGAPAEAALLQTVLRKAFGSEAPPVVSEPTTGEGELDVRAAAIPKRPGETTAKTGQVPQTGNMAMARPATTETMPQLRATAAFLAADPEALSLVSAIAQGEIDPQVEMTFASRTDDKTPSGSADAAGNIEADGAFAAETDAETLIAAEQQETVADEALGEKLVEQHQDEKPLSATDRQPEKPVRILAETLKGLVQNMLPLSEGNLWEMTGLSRQTMPGAEPLQVASLQPGDAAGLEAMLDAATTESDAGWTAELSDEIDSWVAQADAGPEDLAEGHPAWAPLPKADEAMRDPLLQHRLLDGMAGRDAIPFAIIPYLPAKADDDLFAQAAEEQQASAEEEEAGDQTQDEDHPQNGDEDQSGSSSEQEATASDDEDATQDAYALYMRMAGLS